MTSFLGLITAFAIGLTEDLTKELVFAYDYLLPRFQQLSGVFSPGLHIKSGCALFGLYFYRPFLAGAVFSFFIITDVANTYNIIDGFNGFYSMYRIIIIPAIAYIGYILIDLAIIHLAPVMVTVS